MKVWELRWPHCVDAASEIGMSTLAEDDSVVDDEVEDGEGVEGGIGAVQVNVRDRRGS